MPNLLHARSGSIYENATNVAKKIFFKSQADIFLNRLPEEIFTKNQRHKTATKSISGVLVGQVVEKYYNILFHDPDIDYQIDDTIAVSRICMMKCAKKAFKNWNRGMLSMMRINIKKLLKKPN